MSEKKKNLMDEIEAIAPNMSDFDKGYFLRAAEEARAREDRKEENYEEVHPAGVQPADGTC